MSLNVNDFRYTSGPYVVLKYSISFSRDLLNQDINSHTSPTYLRKYGNSLVFSVTARDNYSYIICKTENEKTGDTTMIVIPKSTSL